MFYFSLATKCFHSDNIRGGKAWERTVGKESCEDNSAEGRNSASGEGMGVDRSSEPVGILCWSPDGNQDIS